jgi:tetratricopeptide (TPR) repeat protein
MESTQSPMDSRSVRVFISSTFRDLDEERTLLARQVFPQLRAGLRKRFVELIDIDLRWGITEEQSRKGEVLPICLAEIDRARPDDATRPYFIGILGERYGWVPSVDDFTRDVIDRHPWLAGHIGGKSVTELEILHGVLNDPTMRGRAFFYFRDPETSNRKGADFRAESSAHAARLATLKRRIQESPYPTRQYSSSAELGGMVTEDLTRVLDVAIPPGDIPDEFERENLEHQAYADRRARHHIGGARLLDRLDQAIADGQPIIALMGESGSGKSSLLGRWLERRVETSARDRVLIHHLGASTDASQSGAIVQRALEKIRRQCGLDELVPTAPDQQVALLPLWLATAATDAAGHDARWIWVLDAIDVLADGIDLHWLPKFLPARVHLVVSACDGPVKRALIRRFKDLRIVEMEPLELAERRELLTGYMARYGKSLEPSRQDPVLTHPLSGNPLFLTTLAEELRLVGSHENLSVHLSACLGAQTIGDLFVRVLERVEDDFGIPPVRHVLQRIGVSRAGLSEKEIQDLCAMTPLTWAGIRAALEISLTEAGGRITFSHQFVRQAVKNRYLSDETETLHVRLSLADAFRDKAIKDRAIDSRCAEEEPFQLARAGELHRLRARLLDPKMFLAIRNHRGLATLLDYWLRIERAGVGHLEADHEAVWAEWVDERRPKTATRLNQRVSEFLESSGRAGDFSLMVTRRALSDYEAEYGANDERSLRIRARLGRLLRARGDIGEAARNLRQSIEGLNALGLGESIQHASRLIELAETYRRAGLARKSSVTARAAVLISEKLPDSWAAKRMLLRALQARGEALMDLDDVRSALNCFSRAIKIRSVGRKLPPRLDAEVFLGAARLFVEMPEDRRFLEGSLSSYEFAEKLLAKALGPVHPELVPAILGQASVEAIRGEQNKVQAHIERAFGIVEASSTALHPFRALAFHERGRLAFDRGELESARIDLEQAAAIRRQLGRALRPLLAQSLELLVQVLSEQGDSEAVQSADAELRDIRASFPFIPNAGAARSLLTLALVHDEKGSFALADRSYARAIAHEEALEPHIRHGLAQRHLKAAATLFDLQLFDRARLRLARAEALLIEISVRLPGDEAVQEDLRACRERLASGPRTD